ncbi:fimbria/pilus outer membrane usher protein [Burkholderia stagnalis]|uniref:Usher protein n=2 Tax=Burkholderia stagnalis TaxID=1503054 RepID=A0A119W5H5_9BURK|nr:fimbria/pilus outer membrane usher protein [Burkholderia stagnalis]AOK57501.1 usher protein [Burkholderia stagnalis]KVN84175.1 usher protein [Burkholderia stagnalis]KVZ02893.1 usher protein [Burkholderia stagnalis]KWA57801.1 usher protein [Burkholderia stagnalis]KWA59256.1 usher protein [Burkholderia stagnalis]
MMAPAAMMASAVAFADDGRGTAGAFVHDDARDENARAAKAENARKGAEDVPERVHFDASLLMSGADGAPVDTTQFERPDTVAPGRYQVDVLVNGQWRGVEEIEFRRIAGSEGAQPCYDRQLLTRAGIDLDKSARGQDGGTTPNQLPEGLVCEALDGFVPGASATFDNAEQKLYLTVPQYFMRLRMSTAYVDPSSWTSGVTAAMLNYNANLFSTQTQGQNLTRFYTGLNMGLNVGALRVRHNGNFTWSPHGGSRYQRGYVYGQTDVPAWRAQVLAGESATSGELFDAVSFRGVQIASDDRMLPDTQRYYTPVVRGTANSNAKVSVYQRGYLIYETTVAPGPFAIDDLQAASYGGDLNVTVTEASGEVRSFVVPFATTVQLLRPGVTRFSAMAGQAIDTGLDSGSQYVGQFTLQRGLNNVVTGYGGGAFTGNYQSVLMGAALNTEIGGFAADVTYARTSTMRGDRLNGSSIRVSYSRNLPNSGTNFSLLAYRYSTKGYLGLRDALLLNSMVERGIPADALARMRNRLDVNISQQLGQTGSLYINGSALSFWNQGGQTLSFTVGYSTQWRNMSFSASVQRVRNAVPGTTQFVGGGSSTLASLNVSIPLGRDMRRTPMFNSLATHDSNGGTHVTTGLSGRFGESGNGGYTLSGTYDGNGRTASGSGGLNYRLPAVSLGGNVGFGRGYQQASATAMGGIVLHPGGVTAGPTLGETVGIVEARDARGAAVVNSSARVNRYGYAVVPSLIPYQLNNVDLDPKGMPDNVELKTASRSVAPRAGSVVMLSYDTLKARPLLIDSHTPDGAPLPFAARAVDVASGSTIGAVGQGSRLFIRSQSDVGQVRVEWGGKRNQQCVIDYAVPRDRLLDASYVTLIRACLPLAPLSEAGVPSIAHEEAR